jgi:hypothetical protein
VRPQGFYFQLPRQLSKGGERKMSCGVLQPLKEPNRATPKARRQRDPSPEMIGIPSSEFERKAAGMASLKQGAESRICCCTPRHDLDFCVLSAASVQIVQSALGGIVPADHETAEAERRRPPSIAPPTSSRR